MKLIRCFILFLALSFCLFSCGTDDLSGDIKISNLSPTIGVPIGSVDYTLEGLMFDLIEGGQVTLDTSGTIESETVTLVFRDTLEDFSDLTEFVNISKGNKVSQEVRSSITFTTPVDTDTLITDTLTLTLEFTGNEIVKEIVYGNSFLKVESNSTGSRSISNLSARFLNTTNELTGDTLTKNLSLGETSVALADHKTIFNISSENKAFQKIVISGRLALTSGSTINAGESLLDISLDYSDIKEFKSVTGYFGQKTIDIPDQELKFSFFDEIEPGSIVFSQRSGLEATLKTATNMGIPLGFDFANTNGVRGVTTTPLKSNSSSGSTILTTPGASEIGKDDTISVTLRASSVGYNLDEVLTAAPTVFNVSVDATTNAEADTLNPPLTNFITSDAYAKPFFEVKIPFNVRLEGLEVNLENRGYEVTEDFNELSKAYLRIKTVNEIPLTGTVTLDILSESGDSIRTLALGDTIISAPRVNGSFGVTQASEKVSLIELSKEALADLKEGKSFTIIVGADTRAISQTAVIPMRRDAALKFNVSLLAGLDIEF